MAPFRLGHDEYQHDLPWLLLQNGPMTLYRRPEGFEEDVAGLQERGYRVARFDARAWSDEGAMHDELRVALGMPDYTGRNFDALRDSLTEIDVPEAGGLFLAIERLDEAPYVDVLLAVLADTARWWLLFGRIFGVLGRTDDGEWRPPAVGGMAPQWNRREWPTAARREAR